MFGSVTVVTRREPSQATTVPARMPSSRAGAVIGDPTEGRVAEGRGEAVGIDHGRRCPLPAAEGTPGEVGAVAEAVGARDEVAVAVEVVGPALVVGDGEDVGDRGGHAVARRERARRAGEDEVLQRVVLQPRGVAAPGHVRAAVRRIDGQRRRDVDERHPERPAGSESRAVDPADGASLLVDERQVDAGRPSAPDRGDRDGDREQARALVDGAGDATAEPDRAGDRCGGRGGQAAGDRRRHDEHRRQQRQRHGDDERPPPPAPR